MNFRLCHALSALALLSTLGAAPHARGDDAHPVDVRILAINDLHGNLRPPPGGIRIADPDDRTKMVTVSAGGVEPMASLVRQLREGHPNNIFVAAGDLIGASPLLSAMFHDEPTIESLSMMGLELSSVGNHEFDEGKDELMRMQNGGCHPIDKCQGPHPFPGAKFHYLAASTFDEATGKTILPPYEIREFEGIPAAFIGLTLKGTPGIVSPVGVVGLEFRDEAVTVNALMPELMARGVEAIVMLIHEGGFPTGDYNECPGISGPIVDIVKELDSAVGVVISGHTHKAYVCDIDGRLVTSGDKFGTLVTAIDLKLDRATRKIISAKANNVIVRSNFYPRDAEQTALIEAYDKLAAPIAGRPARSIRETLSRVPNKCRRERARRYHRGARRDQLGRKRRRGDRLDQSGRHPHRHPEEGRRQGYLCRFVCEPAVPQSAGDADADGGADQGRARAAMDRRQPSAHPAGLQGFQQRMGRHQAVWRARHCYPHDAERQAHRSNGCLSRHGEQLSFGRRRRLYGVEVWHRAAIRRLRRRRPLRLFPGQQPDRARQGRSHRQNQLNAISTGSALSGRRTSP
jgi:5'-nucleotidase